MLEGPVYELSPDADVITSMGLTANSTYSFAEAGPDGVLTERGEGRAGSGGGAESHGEATASATVQAGMHGAHRASARPPHARHPNLPRRHVSELGVCGWPARLLPG